MTTPHSSTERPVILIHGVGSTTDSLWRRDGWIAGLEAAGRVVIGLDLPGHGASKDLTDRDPVDLLFEEAVKHGSVDAIGFSAGAWVVLAAAAERPALFHRVAVLGAGDAVLTHSMHTAEAQQPMIQALRSPEKPDNPMVTVILAMIADAGNDPNAVADYLAADKRFPTLEDLARITAPTLAVDGSEDLAGLSDLVLQTVPNATRLTIAGADHFQIPASAECMTAVITFVQEADESSGPGRPLVYMDSEGLQMTSRPANVLAFPASQGIEMDVAPDRFGELRNSNDILNDVAALRDRLQTDGYLLLRSLLDREGILAARQEIVARLSRLGFLDRNFPDLDAVAVGAEQANEAHNELVRSSAMDTSGTNVMADALAQDNDPLDQVLYGPTMMSFFGRLFGESAKHFDFTWLRSIFPYTHGSPAHTDVIFMGRAERDRLLTAWTPIGDVDYEQGGLMILEGSNNNTGLRAGYSTIDVDEVCEAELNAPGWRQREFKAPSEVCISPSPVDVQRVLGGRWLTTEFHAGDVLVFSVFTVHGSLDNHSNRIRLSSDSRYQPASKPADERWIGEHPAGHGPTSKRKLIC